MIVGLPPRRSAPSEVAQCRSGMMRGVANRRGSDRAGQVRRGLRLEYATLGGNVVGVPVLFASAAVSGSVALVAFALDSAIEIFASTVVIWELNGDPRPERTRRATRLIGFAFFALAIYLLVQAAVTLAVGHRADQSPVGMVWIAMTVVVMLALAAGKRRAGAALANPVLLTEAKITVIDALLALSVLVGLALNAVAGWWWADTAASLVIVAYGFREGVHALRDH